MILKEKIVKSIREQFYHYQYNDDGYIILFNFYSFKLDLNGDICLENEIVQTIINTTQKYTSLDLYKFDEDLGMVGNYPINEIINNVVYSWLKKRIIENMGALNPVFNSRLLEDEVLQGEIGFWVEKYLSNKTEEVKNA